jgi:copper(I)-binding protein
MKKSFVMLFILATLFVACTPTPARSPLASQNGIGIDQASVRLPGDGTSGKANKTALLAGYMVIRNTGPLDDSLIGVQADFTGTTMLHKSSVDSNGVATMDMVMSIDVPAGQTVELKPGGFHIMFVGLNKDLKVGDTVTLTLQFQKAGAFIIQAQVTDQ